MGRGPSIEGRKSVEDAKRAKVFTKLIRDITVAARAGGDPAANAKLRTAIDKGLTANMPKDKIERAVRRGSGADGGADLQEMRYEGYGPGGVALIIDALTDNPVRTVADVRHALTKHGGNLGTSGSVAFQFARTGEFDIATPDQASEDRLMEVALDAGADDVQSEDGHSTVLCAPDAFDAMEAALAAAGFNPDRAEVSMRPGNRVVVDGEAAEDLEDLLERLDNLDDVQDVFHNADLS
jgi:YebC/PmpR family DNA-binding regulatory protein